MNYRLSHYILPLACVLLAIVIQYSGIDTAIAQSFYDPAQQSWPYRSGWLTEQVLHRGARALLALLFIGLFAAFLLSFVKPSLSRYRRGLGYILLASFSGILLVGFLKSITHMYTPWDLQLFNGAYPNIRLFDAVNPELPVGHAFPAGHASGGYALLSFYFLARYYQLKNYRWLLYLALAAGLIMGVAQQVRGAHMLSHDMFTLAICWSSGLIWSWLLLHRSARLQFAAADKPS